MGTSTIEWTEATWNPTIGSPTEWVRSGVLACQSDDVAAFVKQLSSGVRGRVSKKPEVWAEDMRVRQFPTVVRTELLSDIKA